MSHAYQPRYYPADMGSRLIGMSTNVYPSGSQRIIAPGGRLNGEGGEVTLGDRKADHGFKGGTVAVTCWCERRIVRVPAAQVGDTTESCGHEDCRPL